MNQTNHFQRNCSEHPEKQVIYVCYNKQCNLNRLLCKICFKIHSNHCDDLLDEKEIEEKMKKSSIQCQQFLEQLNQMLNEIQQQFKLIISRLESQYNLSMEQCITIENKELNKYFNQLIIQKDQQNTIYQQITQGLNSFKQNINTCLNNLTLQQDKINQFPSQEIIKVEQFYQQGVEYGMKNDFVNSIKMFDNALQINQNHLQSLQSKGDSLRVMNQHKESIKCFEKVLKIDPHNKQALYAKGNFIQIQNKQCQFKESIIWFEKALTIDPKFKEALQGKGDALRMLKQYSEAIKYFDFALQIDINYGMSLGSKGSCLLQLGQFDKAEQCLNKAIQLNPENEFNHFQLSSLFKFILELLEQKKQK